ncbi:MAG: hypothetical protein ABL307_11760 [Roseitalea porphyridii]|uniref:hypothetical protein n=1 Tax=Roseitalea porphyridii TaxID=1852022 RepID=UPI0032D8C4A7
MRMSNCATMARNETWSGRAATEPYEAGWASEAVIFLRALGEPVGGQGRAWVEISPDGMHWVPEGAEFPLPAAKDGIGHARVTNFGCWLRLAAELPEGAEITVLVTMHLKS